MSKAYDLKPWTRVAVPHADILGGDFDLSSYAANLGQADAGVESCPVVYRDPVAFYKATYMTGALRELLEGVAGVLSGRAGNRVLQLRTPFGGGKTHTLIALLHLFRHRAALDAGRYVEGIADPGPVRVVVIPCLDLDAAGGREVDGIRVRTVWGELAIRLGGPAAYELVREADELRVNPGGEVLRRVLGEEPVLVLLDEVLTYVEAAMGVPVGAAAGKADTNLGRQTAVFLQNFTEVVRGLPRAAMVYSLQQSVREAVGDEGLLEMLDNLVSRIDAKREPVSGDEVLCVVQKRLFQDLGDPAIREAVAVEYAGMLEDYLSQTAQTESDTRAAKDQAEVLRTRILDAYPFHPELLDLMYHRWGSLPSYQRTRGALQFLATVIGALWKQGDAAGPLIGPGDVPLVDPMVRNTFFSQVGERESMKSVLDSDLLGATARCRRVDDAMAAEVPAYQSYRVGTRLTRALALYSFGAKPGEDRGVLRTDLLAATQLPGLPADVLDEALRGLTDTLLYIHASGRKFRFEKKPNLNKLVDDEVRKVEPHEVLDGVRKELERRLNAPSGYVIWPPDSGHVPDGKPRFQVVFLGPDHIFATPEEQERLVREWTDLCGTNKRRFRNALAFALPSAGALENARTAARRMLAVQRLIDDKARHGFDEGDVADLKRRSSRAGTDLTAASRMMYPTILMPVAAPPDAADPVALERFEIQGHQSLGTDLLEGIYGALANWVFEDAVPRKLVSCARLGEGSMGTRSHHISGPELVAQFFGSLHFPKLLTINGVRSTVAKGVSKGIFGYVMGADEVGDTISLRNREALTYDELVEMDDIDLSEGSFIVSADLAKKLKQVPTGTTIDEPSEDDESSESIPTGDGPSEDAEPTGETTSREVRLQFRATAPQLFAAFKAIQLLSEWADDTFSAQVHIYARGTEPIDRNFYDTAVVMSLEEEGVEVQKS